MHRGPNHLHLVTELCTGPDLFTLLATKKRLTEADAASALACVLHCVAHCHRRGVVHRDVRAETFLQVGARLPATCLRPAWAVPTLGAC